MADGPAHHRAGFIPDYAHRDKWNRERLQSVDGRPADHRVRGPHHVNHE